MFDLSVCLLTLENVGVMLTFIALGYILRRSHALPENTDQVLSRLLTYLFCPAYTISNLSRNLTAHKLAGQLTMVGFGAAVVVITLLLAYFLARLLGRSPLERKSLTYAFTISNFGYFGYPVVQGVFGDGALTDMIIFCLPLTLLTNTFGYILFAGEGKIQWKKVLLSPMLLAVGVGVILGLSGWQLPDFATKVLGSAGGCMSTVSMLLAGVVLGALPLKELLRGWRPYLYTAIRLLLIPALFVGIMFAFGVRDMLLLISGLTLSMPLGLNLVVFPASFGHDTRDNAKMCFASYLLSILVLPITFSLLQSLANM